MNSIKWVLLLVGLQFFVVACASKSPPVTGTQELGNILILEEITPVEEVAINALSDSDEDGVSDTEDDCPNTPGNALVYATGCEIVTGVVEGLEFAPGETELSVDSRVVLGQLVDGFVRYPNTVLAVEGHTDNRGAAATNLEVSKQRVLAVVRFMVANGIGTDRIKPYGFGESRPRAANATPEGRERNRRIEIKVQDRLL